MKKILVPTLLLLVFINAYSQNDRVDIIRNKIRSITQISWDKDTSDKYEIKNDYTQNGNDSLVSYQRKLAFRYKEIKNRKGQVEKLERYDASERLDEIHMFKYYRDGSYSIEVIAHGAGTILESKFNKNNICIQEVYSGIDTLEFVLDNSGKQSSIVYKVKNAKPEQVAIYTYYENGLLKKIESLKDQKTRIYTYNSKNLVSELKEIGPSDEGIEMAKVFLFNYEFWE